MTFTGPRSGRQFVVVAAGGGNKYNNGAMAKLIAFALPAAGDPKEAAGITAPPRVLAKMRADYAGAQEKLPGPAVAQPVPFSHRAHVGAASLKCADCHASAATAERAGIPSTAKCMSCHQTIRTDSPAIASLRKFSQARTQVPWARLYRVPDYVFFSHERHLKAKVECASCHGPVAQRDVLAKEVSTSMAACLDCHRQQKARVDCSACHNLGQ
jgi:hypothetical protein